MKLIIEDDEGRRTVVPVVRDEITIGRNDANFVNLTEKNVSRRHGRLLREADSFYIEDLESFTGIRVNGEKIHGKRQIAEGDLIQISEYDLILQSGPDDRRDAPAKGEVASDPAPAPESATAAEAAPAPVAGLSEVSDVSEAEARKLAETATIRLSDLRGAAGEMPAQEVPEKQRPRLIGISGTYRGTELVLDRSPVRIGRSGENDIEIDHPSISRKHLRLHVENGTWKVMDAESRNGVRVNGEPYAAIGLRHGDVVEMGHLRFAFAEPGRDFKLPPEFAKVASVPPQEQSRRGSALWMAAGVLLVAVLALGTFLVLRGRPTEEDGVEGLQDSKAERKFALRAAAEAVAAHRYVEALRNLDTARRAGATAADLHNYNAVEAEAQSEQQFREMESAATAQDWERARKLLETVSATHTWYGAQAAARSAAVTAGYVNLHVAAAALMKGKDNLGCLAEAQLALAANPASADARTLAEACNRPTLKAASVASPLRRTASTRAPRAGDDVQAHKLLDQGNQKLMAQDLPGAIALYQQALVLKPGNAVLAGAYRSMGIAFTRQGNVEEGAHYYKLYLPLCTDAGEKAQLEKLLADYDARRR